MGQVAWITRETIKRFPSWVLALILTAILGVMAAIGAAICFLLYPLWGPFRKRNYLTAGSPTSVTQLLRERHPLLDAVCNVADAFHSVADFFAKLFSSESR